MIWYYLGPPRSGKSTLAEQLVASFAGQTLYVATLPPDSFHRTTIQQHRARRPQQWDTVELLSDPVSDLAVLSDLIPRYNNILIDGMSYYVFRSMVEFDVLPPAEGLLRLLKEAEKRKNRMVFVDQPIRPSHPPQLKRRLLWLHTALFRAADRILVTDNGTARPMSALAAFRSQRSHV
jgi:adenosyl cobinamide kinase/adenosyl cobinamide phosphate guanylyltransferase